MPTPNDQAGSRLLQLPSELLRLVWTAMKPDGVHLRCNGLGPKALRRTCKAARDVTGKFIHKIELYVDISQDCESAVHSCLRLMANFPRASTMSHLYLSLPTVPRGFPWVQPSSFLPCLMAGAADKLSFLQILDIRYGGTVLGCKDTASIASACPQLTSLHLSSIKADTPVFAPLTRLTALRSLSVQKLAGPLDSRVLGSLSGLSQIVKLELCSVDPSLDNPLLGGEQQLSRAIPAGKVLPHLWGLLSLQSLKLGMPLSPEAGDGGDDLVLAEAQAFGMLQGLSQLTSLCWEQHFPDGSVATENQYLVGRYVSAQLARATQLVDLSLPSSTLFADDIRLLAGMPQLTKLEVAAMHSSEDLSSLQCRWRDVVMRDCPLPDTLLLLPIQQLENVRVRDDLIRWSVPEGAAAPKPERWGKALTVLSRWHDFHDKTIVLCPNSSSSPRTAFPPALMSALLAPLKVWAKPGTNGLLCFRDWALESDVVHNLVKGLPTLSRLFLDSCNVAPEAMATLSSAACLTRLILSNMAVSESDVTAIAVARCMAVPHGPDLTISITRSTMTAEQVERCQATVFAYVRSCYRSWVEIELI